MKKRLIELIKSSSQYVCEDAYLVERIAEHLLANGVIVFPCKIGDEINGEIVHEIDYKESLVRSRGDIRKDAFVHTMRREDLDSFTFCSHPIPWEELLKKH